MDSTVNIVHKYIYRSFMDSTINNDDRNIGTVYVLYVASMDSTVNTDSIKVPIKKKS
jgi:hypothetical protein